jgi:hypothetical protein
MTISERFNLQKSQAELDFINIDPDTDIPLFLDPHFLSKRNDRWSVEATLTLRSFFQEIIDLIRANNMEDARLLFDHLHEPNATCLGLSVGSPDGNGVGNSDTTRIFYSLISSRAIQTGLIQDIQDNILFVDYFGKDKLSDMTTNIITKHLIDYTITQCDLHNIPLTDNIPSGHYWSRRNNDWISEHARRLVINNKPLLLVPKGIASFCKAYTPETYYNHFVLNFLQDENIRIRSALVQTTKKGVRFVTKKSLKEENPINKAFLREFTSRHPEILERFKERVITNPLQNSEISEFNYRAVANDLITKLGQVPSGNHDASAYHQLVLGILEFLLYPDLINPVKEREIHNGRKRIDITFDNASRDGIFHRISEHMRLPCPYIFVECKNYSSDPANPELDQLSGRFSTNRGRLGILTCRNFSNRNLFLNRCTDTFRDDRGLIIPLDDNDLINMLRNSDENNRTYVDGYLSDIVRQVAVN